MGADMMIAVAAAPFIDDDSTLTTDSPERLRILDHIGVTRVKAIPDSRIIAALSVYEIEFAGNEEVIDGLNGGPEADVTEEMLQAARDGLEQFNPFQSRAVCELRIGERTYFATGGLSFGDLPTESFDAVLLLDEVDLWGAPVTAVEVAAACAALDAVRQ